MTPEVCVSRCTITGEHLPGCSGFVRPRGQTQLIACPGCLPQRVARGHLCWSCAEKVSEMWEVLPDMIPHLRSVERSSSPDGIYVRPQPGSRVIIPTSWLAADELWAVMHQLIVAAAGRTPVPTWRAATPWGFTAPASIDAVMAAVWDAEWWLLNRLDDLHNDRHLAVRLMRLVRCLQRALAAFPLQERARMVEHVRCRSCGLMTLEMRPPLHYKQPITVTCTSCGHTYDPQMVTYDMQQLREQYEAARQAVAP